MTHRSCSLLYYLDRIFYGAYLLISCVDVEVGWLHFSVEAVNVAFIVCMDVGDTKTSGFIFFEM